MALDSFVPVKTGVVLLVIRSVLDLPVSLVAARKGVLGAAGAIVSTMTTMAEEAGPRFPAASVALAVIECEASPRVLDVIEYAVVGA